MAEKSSLRRSLRARSLESRPSPSHMSFDEASASNDADDEDGTKNNKLAKKKQMNQSIQPNRRALRKRKVSFKECVTDQKEDSVPEKKKKCDSIEHRQKILSNKWYVDYYDNDTDSVFDVKKCCLCPKKFFSNFALKKHFDVVHKKENFSCQSCSKAFSHAQVLECHERQMHPVRLMPSAMFHTPEIQDILRNCIKQEENIEMSLPQPQRQLPSLLDVVNQAELQKQIIHSPVVTRTKNLEPSTETQPQKVKIPQTEQIFKIPSQSYQRIKTPLKNQLQNFQTSCQTEQQNFPTPRVTQLDIFETQSKEQIVKKALKRKYSFQNSPPKTHNQNLKTPSRTCQLNLQAPLICEPETPPITLPHRSLDRRQSFLHPNYCAICKKQFSQRGYLKVHMESVHALVRQKCELCKKTYSSKNELRKHIKSVHWGEKFEYSKRCSLRTHSISAQTIERDLAKFS